MRCYASLATARARAVRYRQAAARDMFNDGPVRVVVQDDRSECQSCPHMLRSCVDNAMHQSGLCDQCLLGGAMMDSSRRFACCGTVACSPEEIRSPRTITHRWRQKCCRYDNIYTSDVAAPVCAMSVWRADLAPGCRSASLWDGGGGSWSPRRACARWRPKIIYDRKRYRSVWLC